MTHQNLPRCQVEDGRLKIKPLGDWIKDDLEAYFAEYNCLAIRWKLKAIPRSAARLARPKSSQTNIQELVARADGTRSNAVSTRMSRRCRLPIATKLVRTIRFLTKSTIGLSVTRNIVTKCKNKSWRTIVAGRRDTYFGSSPPVQNRLNNAPHSS